MFKISLIERFLLILIAVHKVWESLFRLMKFIYWKANQTFRALHKVVKCVTMVSARHCSVRNPRSRTDVKFVWPG